MRYLKEKILITLLLFCIWNVLAFAQINGKIAGMITDKQTGEPLAGANVIIKGTTLGDTADNQGNYCINNVPVGTYKVSVSMMGYYTMTIPNVRVSVDLTTPLNFKLESIKSSLSAQDHLFNSISYGDIISTRLSTSKINGTDNETNYIPAGTIVVYRTNEGRYGKLKIEQYGYDLKLKWKTYKIGGTVYSEGSNLLIHGTWQCDLDLGVESSTSSDFWWRQVTSVERYLTPLNGASFAIYDPEFNAISLTDIKSASLSSAKINGSDNSSNLVPTGTIMVYQTNEGRYGKLKIVNYGYNLTLKWKTYNANGSVYSEGGNLVIRGTWNCDLDLGVESSTSSDFWWRQVTSVERYLTPLNGASFAIYDPEFNAISLTDIKSTSLSSAKINGSDNPSNLIPTGTIMVYQTNEGRYGKLKIVEYGYDLKLKWKTFNTDGSVYSEGGNLLIRGTWHCDLDQGVESSTSSDFWWEQVTSVERYLVPEHGAKFAVYDPAFDAVSLAYIKSASLSSTKINGSDNVLNQIPVGTVLMYQTNDKRYGKLKIVNYGYNLTLKWKTYNTDGSVYSEGGNLLIRGTWRCDLDLGVESGISSDFWWEQVTSVERYLTPRSGATFGLYVTAISNKFQLSVDHVSQTITPHDTAKYNIEVFCEEEFDQPIQLSIVDPHESLSYSLKPKIVSKTSLVRLFVTVLKSPDQYREYPIHVKAESETAYGIITRYIMMSLIVIAPPPSETMVTLSVGSGPLLIYGILQPIEGKIIPPKQGNIRLELSHPDTMSTIKLVVDSLGRFSHNYIFRKPGWWQADVFWEGSVEDTFYNYRPTYFEVTERQPRITVTTIDPRFKVPGDSLEIVGQVIPKDTTLKVKIDIISPTQDTIKLPLLALTSNGKFHTSYLIADSGLHKITAQIIPGSNPHGMIYRRLMSEGSTTVNSIEANAETQKGGTSTTMVPVGTTKYYAIVLVGGSGDTEEPTLSQQDTMACLVYQMLKARGINDSDILALSQSEFKRCSLKRKDSYNYWTHIQNFLSKISNKSVIFLYLIGKVWQKGDDDYYFEIWQTNPGSNPIKMDKNLQDLALELKLKNDSAKIDTLIYLLAFNYGGNFIKYLHKTNEPKKPIRYSISNTSKTEKADEDGWSSNKGKNSFTGIFAQKIGEDRDIYESFYENARKIYKIKLKSWLDDNMDGTFTVKQNTDPKPGEDGYNSQNVYIGQKTNTPDVLPDTENWQIVANPSGLLLSDQADILVALDNPNDFPIVDFTANIFPPENSKLSEQQETLTYDSTSGAYKSKKEVAFPDSGLYKIIISYSYLDGDHERYNTDIFEKYRFKWYLDTIKVFDPCFEVGYIYAWENGVSSAKPELMIGLNLFSTKRKILEYLGLGVATNFNKLWGLFMPVSVNLGLWYRDSLGPISKFWVYGGVGCELESDKLRHVKKNLRKFVGVKLNITDLFRR